MTITQPPALLVHVGTNDDTHYSRQRGWVAHAADGSVLGFLSHSAELSPPGYESVPSTPLIRITTTQYYEYLANLPLLDN